MQHFYFLFYWFARSQIQSWILQLVNRQFIRLLESFFFLKNIIGLKFSCFFILVAKHKSSKFVSGCVLMLSVSRNQGSIWFFWFVEHKQPDFRCYVSFSFFTFFWNVSSGKCAVIYSIFVFFVFFFFFYTFAHICDCRNVRVLFFFCVKHCSFQFVMCVISLFSLP